MPSEGKSNLELRRFAIDNIIVLSRIFGMSVFAIIVTMILAQDLGPAGKGTYDLVILLTSLVGGTVFNLGIPFGNVYYAANRQYDLKTIVSSNTALLLILIPLTLLTAFAVIKFAGGVLFGDVPEAILYLGLLLMPFFVFDQTLSRIFNGVQDFRSLGMVDVTQPFTTAVLMFGLVITNNLNVVTAIIALIIGYILTNALTVWLLRPKLDSWRDFLPRMNWHYARDLIVYGLKIYANIIFGTLLLRVDVLLISSIGGGAASVGIYAVAVTLGERIWTLAGFTNIVLLPRIASWQNENDKRNQLTFLSAKYTIWISIIGAIILAIFGRWAINALFSARFSSSFDALMALLPGIMMYNFARIFSVDLVGRGQGGRVLPYIILAVIVNILLNFFLIPRYDFIGAALASSAAYTIYALTLMRLFFKVSQLRLVDMILPDANDIRRVRTLFGMVYTYTGKLFSH